MSRDLKEVRAPCGHWKEPSRRRDQQEQREWGQELRAPCRPGFASVGGAAAGVDQRMDVT